MMIKIIDSKNGQLQSYEQLAKNKNAGFFNMYSKMGSIDEMIAIGATTDSIHLVGNGDYLTYWNLHKLLFPYPTRYSDLAIDKLSVDYIPKTSIDT